MQFFNNFRKSSTNKILLNFFIFNGKTRFFTLSKFNFYKKFKGCTSMAMDVNLRTAADASKLHIQQNILYNRFSTFQTALLFCSEFELLL